MASMITGADGIAGHHCHHHHQGHRHHYPASCVPVCSVSSGCVIFTLEKSLVVDDAVMSTQIVFTGMSTQPPAAVIRMRQPQLLLSAGELPSDYRICLPGSRFEGGILALAPLLGWLAMRILPLGTWGIISPWHVVPGMPAAKSPPM